MIGHNRPSRKVDEIYSIMEDYETEGIDFYNFGVINAITDYFISTGDDDKFQLHCNAWNTMDGGGICSLAFVDNGYPFLITFEYA